MIRHSLKTPGNDCMYGTCSVLGCPGKTGWSMSGHGIAAEKWVYAVRKGKPYSTITDGFGPVLGLTVYTDIYPDTVPKSHPKTSLRDPIRGIDLSLHECERPPGDFVMVRDKCWLVAGTCYITQTTALGADEFFKKHGVHTFEQPESFWLALEAEFQKWTADRG